MTKIRNNTISHRIKKALLGLTFGLSIIFTLLIFLLVYIVEDDIFVNLLKIENQEFQQLEIERINDWQPHNRSMQLITDHNYLPASLKKIDYTRPGVYEYFNAPLAYFVMFDYKKSAVIDEKVPYYMIYDVSDLLSVRKGKKQLIAVVISVAALIMIVAMLIAIRLSKKILQPLKKLTDQLQEHDHINVAKGFSLPFAGDEIGTLAQELEVALQNVQKSAQKAFEFNRGVSHELRSPIQVAINATELLTMQHEELNQSATMDRLKRSITQMQKISQAFLWLVSDRSLETESTDIKHLISQLTSHFQTFIDQKIIINQTEQTFYYHAPQSVLTIIIESLINNAIQHGSQGNIVITINENMLTIKNSNTDKKLWSKENQNTPKGYGIGLIIVKRLCQKLNWQMHIEEHQSSHYCVSISAIESSSQPS